MFAALHYCTKTIDIQSLLIQVYSPRPILINDRCVDVKCAAKATGPCYLPPAAVSTGVQYYDILQLLVFIGNLLWHRYQYGDQPTTNPHLAGALMPRFTKSPPVRSYVIIFIVGNVIYFLCFKIYKIF
jgi:hypothetical protein